MSYGLAIGLCVLFCLDSWSFSGLSLLFLLQWPSLYFFWSAGFFSGRFGLLAGLLQLFLCFYVFTFTSLYGLGCSLLASHFPLNFSSGLCSLIFCLNLKFFFDFWFWRDFFVFPPFFWPALMCFSHIILLHTNFSFFLLQTQKFFLLPFNVGWSLSFFLRKLGGDAGSLDKWETLHKFFLASCRFQRYSIHLNNFFLAFPF
jgi:hypothetical protein